MGQLEELWPLFGLRVRTGGLELRAPTDPDLAELAELAREPIHDPGDMPFFQPWTDQPEETRVRSVLQWNWRTRADWSPDDWRLELVAVREGRVVGTQGLQASQFPVLREVETGSWLGRRHQGQGIGREMRRAVLHLAFAGLGARAARSGAFSDNLASRRVSERLGYEEDGTELKLRRGEPARLVRFLLTREGWEARRPAGPEVTIEGLEACLGDFGLGDSGPGPPAPTPSSIRG